MEPEKGAWAVETGRASVHHSSYLATAGQCIYAITEAGNNSLLSAFGKESLHLINRTADVQPDPCYLICHKKRLLTANYTGGNISLFPILQNGAIGTPLHTPKECGSGPEQRRQRAAHIHSLQVLEESAPDGAPCTFIVAADLGSDRLRLYRALLGSDGEIEGIVANSPASCSVPPGSGPRHFAIHKGLKMIYLLNEISGSIISFRYSIVRGEAAEWNLQLAYIEEIATEQTGAQASADIHLSPDGRFLYSSNRNIEDGIVHYEIAPDGTLIRRGFTPTAKHPRNFAITPCGEYMVVACKNSNVLQLFRRNLQSGTLTKMWEDFSTGNNEPVCIVIEAD